MDKIFEIVKKYIDEYDYYKLLYNGAPDDEFDDYINMVVNEINSNSTAENIAESIARAFIKGFGEDIAAKQFIVIAQKIKSELYEAS